MVGAMSIDNEQTPPARPPLDPIVLRTSLVRPGGLWREITVAETTGSTNADLADRAAQGAPEGTVLAAEEQLAGRGRMGRQWVSPARSAVMVSVLLRPAAIAPARRGWLPLLAGVAAATAVRQTAGVPAVLKWPNDLLVGERKLAGILAEQSGDAIVVGLGLNVSATEAELPDTGPGAPAATSLRLEGATGLDRTALLAALLAEFERWYRAWGQTVPPGDPAASGLRAAYLELCTTVGREVRVERAGGQSATARATGLDSDGRLVIEGPAGSEAVSAGDVRHLR
jgi:BirA family transcriptional regulator, biotin operon repressor / biotin---[acetyl-CoA-carboxylase] ligase